jgi:hypothetical protein
MKTLHPHKQQKTDDSFCTTCVYHSMNLDRSLYEGKGASELRQDGCSLDFIPGDKGCNEMRTSNCSARKNKN